MADRASILERTLVGRETTPGTPVTAGHRLMSQAWSLDPQLEFDTFRPEGHKWPTLSAPIKEWSGGSIEGRATYNELVIPLSSLVAKPTSGAGVQIMDGLTGTGAYTWTFNSDVDDADDPNTFTVEAGQTGTSFAQKCAYGIVTELGLSFDRDGAVELDGAWMGQALTDNISLSASTAIVPEPLLITHVDVYLDTTSGAIGTTKLTRLRSCGVTIGDRHKPIWTINSAVSGYAGTVEGEPSGEIEMSLEADATGMGILTAMARTGGTRYLRVRATGPQIYSGGVQVFNRFTFDAAIKVSDVGEKDDDEGITVQPYTFTIAEDSAWSSGKAYSFELINTLATI